MNRRNFINGLGLGGVVSATDWVSPRGLASGHREPELETRPGLPAIGDMPEIRWVKGANSQFYAQAVCEGTPLVYRGPNGLLTASWTIEGDSGTSKRLGLKDATARFGGSTGSLRHRLLRAGRGTGEDVLEAELTLRNGSGSEQWVTLEFSSSARPFCFDDQMHARFPLTAIGLEKPGKSLAPAPWAASNMRQDQFVDCEQPVISDSESGGPLVAHYLEAHESDPDVLVSQAPLLIPLVDLHNPKVRWGVALFCSPLRAWRISSESGWSCRTRVNLAPGAEVVEKCYLFVHRGGPEFAWRAFHTLAHQDGLPRIGWLDDVMVHYYDFLGPGIEGGRRGRAYDEDVHEFRAFHVGLATQHGYYPFYGDYINPNRKTWQAMKSDSDGPVPMSLDLMRARIKAARDAGARAAIYLHQNALDSSSPLASRLREAAIVGKEGKPLVDSYSGPDATGRLYLMSMASPMWRKHFLQQVEWIMELLRPDAIVVDETFRGLDYDYRSGKPDGLAKYMIQFEQDIRRLVRSFGNDKALFTSDCCWANFVMWADGDAGDHENIYHPEYRKTPVRYLSALGDKRWLPCLWRAIEWWDYQMDLSRKTGAGIAIGSGTFEYAVFTGQPQATHAKMLVDISMLRRWRGR